MLNGSETWHSGKNEVKMIKKEQKKRGHRYV